jgi:hypothetical protein
MLIDGILFIQIEFKKLVVCIAFKILIPVVHRRQISSPKRQNHSRIQLFKVGLNQVSLHHFDKRFSPAVNKDEVSLALQGAVIDLLNKLNHIRWHWIL